MLESESYATSKSSVTTNLIVADGKVCVGNVEDINTNAFLSVGRGIYIPREIGEESRELRIYNFEGNLI